MHWIPWRFITKRAAKAYGFIDPVTFLARLRRFSQPSEIQEPIELLRAGILFHARGLINTKAIQHNLDWAWPYWVERQFNPADNSFIPRGFSFSHVNLTHRNWTAVGQPELPIYPIVDPRGLVTPLYDGWSIDFWFMTNDGRLLLPSRIEEVEQELELDSNLCVKTLARKDGIILHSSVWLDVDKKIPGLYMHVTGGADSPGWIVAALRPYNPEGIQFVEKVSTDWSRPGWLVNGRYRIKFSEMPSGICYSNYDAGDVIHRLGGKEKQDSVSCRVGMASAAAVFYSGSSERRSINVEIPLESELPRRHLFPSGSSSEAWQGALSETARLAVPDRRIQYLYDSSLRTLLLLSARQIVPGPYTYKRFWFRDACMMLNALMAAGSMERSRIIMDSFPDLQKVSGYFQSQEGEWDSNGQVMWIMERCIRLSGMCPSKRWLRSVYRGAQWIKNKRCDRDKPVLHAGLFPPGFSAEHLGPNDYYYWDDFWGLAGLRAAEEMAGYGYPRYREEIAAEARDFEKCIFKSIERSAEYRRRGCIPASPYRRMDAGAIGSMVADYPIQLTGAFDEGTGRTMEFLISHCFFRGAFFQDMIHSGINIYLTLAIAQSLLRRRDERYRDLVRKVSDMASPTGQWPEAVHPITCGGCMGDGQHGWAAAEWIMMIRNLFVREEGDYLIIGSGVFPEWLESGGSVFFGPTPTPFGPLAVRLEADYEKSGLNVSIEWERRGEDPEGVLFEVPGYRREALDDFSRKAVFLKELEE